MIFGSTTGAFSQNAVAQLGGYADDTLTGTSAAGTLAGGAGNNLLIGNGGADVLSDGAGDDTFALDADNVLALTWRFGGGDNTAQLAPVDDGNGIDTMELPGAGIGLDRRRIANQGAAAPPTSLASDRSSVSTSPAAATTRSWPQPTTYRIWSTCTGSTPARGQRWAGRTAATRSRPKATPHQLIVDGDTGDSAVSSTNTSMNAGTAFDEGISFAIYNSIAGRARVL